MSRQEARTLGLAQLLMLLRYEQALERSRRELVEAVTAVVERAFAGVEGAVMTMQERIGDMKAFPDPETEDDVLRDFTEDGDCTYGYSYNRTIGDLLVDILTDSPFGPIEQGNNEPENWQSLEDAFIKSTVLQLKAANFCLTRAAQATDDESFSPDLDRDE